MPPRQGLMSRADRSMASLVSRMGKFGRDLIEQRRCILSNGEQRCVPDILDRLPEYPTLRTLCDLGQYGKAEPLNLRSLKINEAKLGKDHSLVAASLNNLALLYWDPRHRHHPFGSSAPF